MAQTKRIPLNECHSYFERVTLVIEREVAPRAATIEVMSPKLGAQVAARTMRLLGLSYDEQKEIFEVILADLNHMVECPGEVWVMEEPDGLLSAVELRCGNDLRQIVYMYRSGPPALRPNPLVDVRWPQGATSAAKGGRQADHRPRQSW